MPPYSFLFVLDNRPQTASETIARHQREGGIHRQADEFSRKNYVGFSVIKPLAGCPVGRTVLRCFPEKTSEAGYVRRFDCACDYRAHVLGILLHIRGLAFQQQDVGVSACATTALWSALQRTRALEETSAATPAQITIRASQYALPFGRSMPRRVCQSTKCARRFIRSDKRRISFERTPTT